jgi:hypothetical protein
VAFSPPEAIGAFQFDDNGSANLPGGDFPAG